ncbi:MAG: sugar ABC transporter permease [Caldilineaceae bacterium]|nr:sugar ABC transporter permease [Caldilineaceae bacterium]
MAEVAIGGVHQPKRKQRSFVAWLVGADSDFQKMDAIYAYLFALPWILGLLVFIGGPMIYSFYLSFTEHSIVDTPTFVGLENYRRAFFDDDLFYTSLARTFYFAILVVPTSLIGSLFLAMLLDQKLRGRNVYRTIFFIPHLTPEVAMAVIWLWLLHPQLGPINDALRSIGLPDYEWLSSRSTVVPSLAMIAFWAGVGGNRMLIFLAGLQGCQKNSMRQPILMVRVAGANFGTSRSP